MSAALVRETLDLLDFKGIPVEKIPCQIQLNDRHSLIVDKAQFGHLIFGIIVHNNRTLKWNDSDIIEYFLDEETCFFIEDTNACFSKSGDYLGYSATFSVEKIQTFVLVDLIQKTIGELNRFIDEFTAV